MNDKSKTVFLPEYRKSRDKKELQEERDAIQSERFYKPPKPGKSLIGGMHKASLLEKWLITMHTAAPPGLSEEESELLQTWLKNLYLPSKSA